MEQGKGGETAPALGVSLEMQYAGGRRMVLQTHVPQDVSGAELDGLLDKLNASADRAEAYYAQEQARRQLEVEEKALMNFKRRLIQLDDNIRLKATADGRRTYKPSAKDEMDRKQALDTLDEGERRVAEARKFLDELIGKAGNRDGASGAANR